jgi:hypothetical protein
MSDQVFLSFWIRGFTAHNMLRNFEVVLRRFPVSRLDPRMLLRIHAIDETEPVLVERLFESGALVEEIVAVARESEHADCSYEVATSWDLWKLVDGDWQLAPAPVSITCYGPLFPSEMGEQILIELGPDYQFLPQPATSASLRPVRSNIRSLLHLTGDFEKSVLLDKRLLWSETGENLAERLAEALHGDEDRG